MEGEYMEWLVFGGTDVSLMAGLAGIAAIGALFFFATGKSID